MLDKSEELTKTDGKYEEDSRYVQKSKNGDEAAFGYLYRKYREKIYLHIYYMVSHKDDALDLTTDTFIKAFKSIKKFREDSSFYTWVMSIATRVAIDHLRKRKKYVHQQLEDDIPARDVDVLDDIDRERIAELIFRAQEILSPKEQACFTLRFFEEKSVNDTAEIMGVKNGTVKALYHRAFNKMKEYIARNMR